MSEELKLGHLITSEQRRDAVHIAVAPVRAGERLKPGQHVSLIGVEAWASAGEPIGVVDPFLKETSVRSGQMFWLYLYPGSIRSLRHEWTHPAFGEEAPTSDPKSASEKWMRAWAMQNVSDNYYGEGNVGEEAAYAFAIRAGHELFIGPYESARDNIDNEWWAHWEAITGSAGKRGEYFSCAC